MKYELLLVAAAEKGDALLTRVEKYVRENGTDLKVDRLGKKQLAYKIKKQTDGNYFVLTFEAQGNVVKSLTDKLRLEQEDLLRYMLLKNIEKKVSKKRKKEVVVEEKEQKAKPKVTVAVKSSASVKSKKDKKEGITKTSKTKGKSK